MKPRVGYCCGDRREPFGRASLRCTCEVEEFGDGFRHKVLSWCRASFYQSALRNNGNVPQRSTSYIRRQDKKDTFVPALQLTVGTVLTF